MNTNPRAKRILCFGDSNTWGRIPGDDNKARYPSNIRWTGVLQDLLGKNYEIIEEGLNGRTTTRNSPFKAGKNGIEYLFPSLESQNPIDLVILALGKNELKSQYNVSAENIGDGISKCIKVVKKEGFDTKNKIPKILLISPAIIIEKPRYRFDKIVNDFEGGNKKSKKLARIYETIAIKENAFFIDSSKIIEVGSDGIHINEESHSKLGKHLANFVKDIIFKN